MTFASGGQRSIQLSYGRNESQQWCADFECAILRAKRAAVQPLRASPRFRFHAAVVRV